MVEPLPSPQRLSSWMLHDFESYWEPCAHRLKRQRVGHNHAAVRDNALSALAARSAV